MYTCITIIVHAVIKFGQEQLTLAEQYWADSWIVCICLIRPGEQSIAI